MSRGRGGEPKTSFPFLSFPAPLVPATTFFAPFSTMPLCVSRSWILAPLSLKETETTTTQAKISVNHAASRVAVKSRIRSRNLAFSRIPHYSSLKSRIPRIPLHDPVSTHPAILRVITCRYVLATTVL